METSTHQRTTTVATWIKVEYYLETYLLWIKMDIFANSLHIFDRKLQLAFLVLAVLLVIVLVTGGKQI